MGENGPPTGLAPPVWEYPHAGPATSVTGGYVYEGSALPFLAGRYVYGDLEQGRIWALDADAPSGPINTELLDTSLRVVSFGVDENDELYVVAFDEGKIYRLEPAILGDPTASRPGSPDGPSPTDSGGAEGSVRAGTTMGSDSDGTRLTGIT